LNRIRLAIPRVSEQRAIARILGALDDKIELNRRMNATLEAMARTLFKSWFVDFDPVRAKMAGRDTGLPKDIADLFPDRLVESELGEIPEGWEHETLERLAATNANSWTAKHHPPAVEYVDLGNTKWGTIVSTSLLDWEMAPSRARRVARVGDTIVGTTRPGNGSFAYISRDGLTASTGFAVLSPRREWYQDAVYLAATNAGNVSRLANLAEGHAGAYPSVKPKDISDTAIVFPGDQCMAAFSGVLSPNRIKIEHSKAESAYLAQIRDTLLPKLISGQLRVRDAERLVEKVA